MMEKEEYTGSNQYQCMEGAVGMTVWEERSRGLLLCLAVAIPCWLLGKAVPVVGGPVFAILAGMAITLF